MFIIFPTFCGKNEKSVTKMMKMYVVVSAIQMIIIMYSKRSNKQQNIQLYTRYKGIIERTSVDDYSCVYGNDIADVLPKCLP